MRGLDASAVFIVSLIIVLIEILAYYGILQIFRVRKQKHIFSIIYGIITVCFLLTWSFTLANPEKIRQAQDYDLFYFVIGFSILNLVPKAVVAIGSIVSFLTRLFSKQAKEITNCISIILGIGLSLCIGYGIFIDKRSIIINEVDLELAQLPKELDGITIAQISDLHLGSFNNDNVLQRAANKINAADVDLLLFTGDIVNNFATEIDGFESALASMKAKHGKFAILGNHDYGDYSKWNSKHDKAQNQIEIINDIKLSGYTLLSNDNRRVEYNDTCLYIIGVENWGHKPFPQYADLPKATKNIPANAFTILLTHDPAHWDDEVRRKTSIPLSLSGHTHGAQFGYKIAGISFSPMYLKEKLWAGLYKDGNQQLYVNQGFGSVGFPGRIDMNPEITIITLKAKS